MKKNSRLSRRGLLGSMAAGAGLLSLPRWAQAGLPSAQEEWELVIERTRRPIAQGRGRVITVNGQYPGPLVRLREGSEAVLRVRNTLDEWSSIHWHGLLLPPEMDGVPGVSFAGIPPGETFEYRFPVRQSGTYWYHSHSGPQEQLGLAGPLVIDGEAELESYDRELIIMLTDWTFRDPARIMAILKKDAGYFNYQKRTVVDALSGRDGMGLADTARWGRMRMDPTDLSDVTGSTYHYLINGHTSVEPWTGVFSPGERVRLRIINAGAMTYFDLRIPGLPMKVVSADGIEVRPVEVDELRIAVAETYDVIIEPEDRAYTLYAETMDRSGHVHATLAPEPGMVADVPERRRRPLLNMSDMGMSMEGMSGMDGTSGMDGKSGMEGMPGMDGMSMNHGSGSEDGASHMEGVAHGDMGMDGKSPTEKVTNEAAPPGPPSGHHMARMKQADLSGATYAQRSAAKGIAPADLDGLGAVPAHGSGSHGSTNPMVAQQPRRRLAERPTGLTDVPWRVLCYADLEARHHRPDPGPVSREIELHLTGHMERYIWSFDGKKFSEDPFIDLTYGERVRIVYVNDTMMNHPLHLHGMFVELENGRGASRPLKHTISVAPAERISLLVTADELGDWAFHCHLLYHMDMGMFRIVRVRPGDVARSDR